MLTAVSCMSYAHCWGSLHAHGCSWHASLLFHIMFTAVPSMLTAVSCMSYAHCWGSLHAHGCSWQASLLFPSMFTAVPGMFIASANQQDIKKVLRLG
jgi:hypothetical protein